MNFLLVLLILSFKKELQYFDLEGKVKNKKNQKKVVLFQLNGKLNETGNDVPKRGVNG